MSLAAAAVRSLVVTTVATVEHTRPRVSSLHVPRSSGVSLTAAVRPRVSSLHETQMQRELERDKAPAAACDWVYDIYPPPTGHLLPR